MGRINSLYDQISDSCSGLLEPLLEFIIEEWNKLCDSVINPKGETLPVDFLPEERYQSDVSGDNPDFHLKSE